MLWNAGIIMTKNNVPRCMWSTRTKFIPCKLTVEKKAVTTLVVFQEIVATGDWDRLYETIEAVHSI